MAENAPLNIARPYVVIMTPTRELCTQVMCQFVNSWLAIKMCPENILPVID